MKYKLEFTLIDIYLERLYEQNIITLSEMEEIRVQMIQIYGNDNDNEAFVA